MSHIYLSRNACTYKSAYLGSTPEGKYVALESGFYPGQHVGVRENGELQPPPETPARHRASLFIPFPQFSTPPANVCLTMSTM